MPGVFLNPGFLDATSRGPSERVFAGCPSMAEIDADPSLGWYWDEQFKRWINATSTTTNGYITTIVGSSSALKNAEGDTPYVAGAGLKLLTTTTEYEGVNIQLQGTDFRAAAGYTIYGEFSLNLYNALTADVFLGLADIDATVLASSVGHALSTTDHVGFKCATGDGVILFTGRKASGTESTKTCTTAVANTTVKLGFRIKGVSSVEHFVNGVKVSTTLATAAIPIIACTPSIAIRSYTTTAITSIVRWGRIIQKVGEER